MSSESGRTHKSTWPPRPEPPASDKVWQEGACHCHAVEFRVFFPPLQDVPADKEAPFVCNCSCSICTKNGYLLIYPLRTDVEFTKGWDELKDYMFASKTRDHKFCGACGSTLLIDFRGKCLPEDRLGINIRMLKGFDEKAVEVMRFDGRAKINPKVNEQYA